MLSRAKSVRQRETNRKMKISKQNESIIFPESKGRVVSFKEHIESQKHQTSKDFKFEVLQNDFTPTAPPIIIDKTEKNKENMGSYQIKHVDENLKTKRPPILSCHRLPGVNIRPALVVENIPGLYFEGNDRKPNLKIKVEHIIEDIDEISLEEIKSTRKMDRKVEREDLSVTDSTTSKFEKLEEMLEQIENKKLPIKKIVTREEYQEIDKELLKKRVAEILSQKLPRKMTNNGELSLSEGKKISKEEQTHKRLPVAETLSASPQSDPQNTSQNNNKQLTEVKSAEKTQEKYSSSFESDNSNQEKENSELNSSQSQKSLIKTISPHSENFSEENATLDDHYEISPDSSAKYSPQHKEEENVNIPENPRERCPSPDGNYPKMLSTIEEVTSVIATENSSKVSLESDISSEDVMDSPKYVKAETHTIQPIQNDSYRSPKLSLVDLKANVEEQIPITTDKDMKQSPKISETLMTKNVKTNGNKHDKTSEAVSSKEDDSIILSESSDELDSCKLDSLPAPLKPSSPVLETGIKSFPYPYPVPPSTHTNTPGIKSYPYPYPVPPSTHTNTPGIKSSTANIISTEESSLDIETGKLTPEVEEIDFEQLKSDSDSELELPLIMENFEDENQESNFASEECRVKNEENRENKDTQESDTSIVEADGGPVENLPESLQIELQHRLEQQSIITPNKLEFKHIMEVETGKLSPEMENNYEKDYNMEESLLSQKQNDDKEETKESESEFYKNENQKDVLDSQKSCSERDAIMRQDTLVSISEIDMPSSGPGLSEGEIVLNPPEVSSDGEVSFGAAQTDQTEAACSQSYLKPGKMSDKSEGECSLKNLPNESSGVEEYLGDYSTSEGELGEKVQRKKTNLIRSDLARRVLESSGSTSSFSEGEWRASPARMRRFLNMASAYRMIEKKD